MNVVERTVGPLGAPLSRYIDPLGATLSQFCIGRYFEFMSKAFFHKLPTVLCKIVGVYQIGYHNKNTGKRQMDQAR